MSENIISININNAECRAHPPKKMNTVGGQLLKPIYHVIKTNDHQ